MRNRVGRLACALRKTALLGSISLAACSGAHEPAHVPVATLPRGSVAATANVPALLGTSIDELRRRLGPTQPLPPGFSDSVYLFSDSMMPHDSATAFRLGGLLVVANYDARTRQVHDLLLLGQHEDSLIGRASLRPNAGNYLIMPVFKAGSNNRLLGLRIVPTTN